MNDKIKAAIGATIGAAFLWVAALGLGDGTTLFGITQDIAMNFATTFGAVIGAVLALFKKKDDAPSA